MSRHGHREHHSNMPRSRSHRGHPSNMPRSHSHRGHSSDMSRSRSHRGHPSNMSQTRTHSQRGHPSSMSRSRTHSQRGRPSNMSRSPSFVPSCGIHLFAVCDELTNDVGEIIRDHPAANHMVISIARRSRDGDVDVKQWCPPLSSDDKKQLFNYLDFRGPKMGHYITWHALDIVRILGIPGPMLQLVNIREHKDTPDLYFKTWCCYKMTSRLLDLSKHIARNACERIPWLHFTDWHYRQLGVNPSNIPLPLLHRPADHRIGYKMPTCTPVEIRASTQLQRLYMRHLPLFRLRWLEIQNDMVEMKGYTIESLPLQPTDVAHGTSITRMEIQQTRWESHVEEGTIVLLNWMLVSEEIARVVRVGKSTRVVITVEKAEYPWEIRSIHVVHGGERLYQIIDHLRLGQRLLQSTTPQLGGLLFCENYFGLQPSENERVQTYFAAEVDHAREAAPRRSRDQSEIEWQRERKAYAERKQESLETTASDMDSERYQTLNAEQLACMVLEKQFISCLGYPGTGKTRTLAGMILWRFRLLLGQPSGWIICVSNSNAAVLNMLAKILEYPSVRPWVRHRYNKMFKAFHPLQFEEFDEYRVTPNMQLAAHGIMVCTIGCLSALCCKYPKWLHQVFDLVIDEAGQLWDFDCLVLLSRLPNVKRCTMFGDDRQLPAYISRLLREQYKTQSALNIARRSDLNKFVSKLVVQYRAVPALCRVHAPVFYPYPIRTHREENLNRGGPSNTLPKQGYYYSRLPDLDRNPLEGSSLLEYEVNKALDIYQQIRGEAHVSPITGKEYEICILTQYKETERALREAIIKRAVQEVEISTVQKIQGCEVDVTIVTSSRDTIHDLNLCRRRGNVAFSRAREYTVMMATDQAVTSACQKEQDRHPLTYWGELLREASAFEPDGRAEKTLTKVRRILKRHRVTDRDESNQSQGPHQGNRRSSHRDPPRNLARERSQEVLENKQHMDMPIDSPARRALAMELALRDNPRKNKNVHINMFTVMRTCSITTLEDILRLYSTETDLHKRTRAVGELAEVNRNLLEPCTPDDRRLVEEMYKN